MPQTVEERLAVLEQKVQELTDVEAIRRLRFRYHECVNETKLSDIPELFTEDGDLDFGYLGKARGKAALKKFFDALPKLLSFVKQFIHNHDVDVQGATGRDSAISKRNQSLKERVIWSRRGTTMSTRRSTDSGSLRRCT